MRLERWAGMSRWTILAWNVARERSAASQSASVSCRGPWCSVEAFDWVREVFSVGAWEVMRVEWGGELAGEDFDEPAVLFLFRCVMEHFPVVRGVVCAVLGSPSLVRAAEKGNFFGDELSGGSRGEVTVVGWVIAQLGLVADDRFGVFVSTEGFVYGFFPYESEVADVG